MSGRSGDVAGGAMKAVGFCVLLLLFSTVADGVSAAPGTRGQPSSQTPAATYRASPLAWLYMPALHMPSAGDAAGGAPSDPPKPNSTPMPAPAATNHYAGLVE